MTTAIKVASAFLLIMGMAACERPLTDSQSDPAKPVIGDAVQLKEGHGLLLHPKLRESIDIKVAEIGELPVEAEFAAQLHVTGGAGRLQRVAFTPGGEPKGEASGWIPAENAKRLQPGQVVDLRADGAGCSGKGTVAHVEKAPFAGIGEYEVVVETDTAFDTGAPLNATFRAPAGEAVTAVPRSALLKTVEGWFVYAVNESFFLRTPVKVGAMNGQHAEITDGLYAGDQVVTSPVETLWMAELQLLRGGKACTCGH
jgi:hypothetical protein